MKPYLFKIITFLIIIFSSSSFAQMMNFEPCHWKKIYETMPLPPETEVVLAAGHLFRIKDPCIPIDVILTWTNDYNRDNRAQYHLEFSQVLPGELYYRLDREEFVMVANALNFKGRDTMNSFKAKGWYCIGADCRKTARFKYGQSWAHSLDIPGIGVRNTSTFQYTYPETEYYGEPVPEIIDITATMIKFDNGTNTWQPSIPTIKNLRLNPFTDYDQMVDAVEQKKIYSKTITYNHDEDPEEIPTKNKGKVKIDFMFHCPTKLDIVKPIKDQKLLFSADSTGKLVIEAEAKLSEYPDVYLDKVIWSAPEKAGAVIEYSPANRKGKKIKITYKGLPKFNTDFGPTLISANLDMGYRCGKFKANSQVKLFFPRDAFNNPGQGGDPNWYYYWLQTKAGHGTTGGTDVRYHGSLELCQDHDFWGYFPYDEVSVSGQNMYKGRSYVYLCNFLNHNSTFTMDPVTTDTAFDGIDTFGVALLHELHHRKHWKEWWNPKGGWPVQGYYDSNNNNQPDSSEIVDSDLDYMPDKLEVGLGFKKNNKYTFSAQYGQGTMYDEHILTYKVSEKNWQLGSADKEDWAKPGHQWE